MDSKSTSPKSPLNDLDQQQKEEAKNESSEKMNKAGRVSSPSEDSLTDKPIRADIENKLRDKFNPQYLEIIDESHKHAHHSAMKEGAGHMSPSGETHFKVIIVSDVFEAKILIDRHRLVNECLAMELSEKGVHALSI